MRPNPSSHYATDEEQWPSHADTASMALDFSVSHDRRNSAGLNSPTFCTPSRLMLTPAAAQPYPSSASSELGGLPIFANPAANG